MKAIIEHTLRALIREKILFNILGITVLMLFFGYMASRLVYGNQYKVMLDLGLMANTLSIWVVAGSVGARFFRNDIEAKTIYLFLVRPISRTRFYLGRLFGMALFVALNYLLLNLVLVGFLFYLSGNVNLAFGQSVVLTLIEAWMILAFALTMSFWFRPGIVLMLLFAFIFLGHNHDLIQSMQNAPETQSLLFDAMGAVLPRLNVFSLNQQAYYADALPWSQFFQIVSYGFFWSLLFVVVGRYLFIKRNL